MQPNKADTSSDAPYLRVLRHGVVRVTLAGYDKWVVHAVRDILYSASLWVLPVVLAITLHEAAHGFVAHRLGDDTAIVWAE